MSFLLIHTKEYTADQTLFERSLNALIMKKLTVIASKQLFD